MWITRVKGYNSHRGKAFALFIWGAALALTLSGCGGGYRLSGDAYVHHVVEIDTTDLDRVIEKACRYSDTPALCESDLYADFMDAVKGVKN